MDVSITLWVLFFSFLGLLYFAFLVGRRWPASPSKQARTEPEHGIIIQHKQDIRAVEIEIYRGFTVIFSTRFTNANETIDPLSPTNFFYHFAWNNEFYTGSENTLERTRQKAYAEVGRIIENEAEL